MNMIQGRQLWQNVWGDAMEPTIVKSSDIVVDRFHYAKASIERWDVVIIVVNHEQIKLLPQEMDVEITEKHTVQLLPQFAFVKRIVGLPGEQLDLSPTRILINGCEQPLPSDILKLYRNYSTEIFSGTSCVIPDGCVYLLSDNLTAGIDSRNYGPIPIEYIIGKVVT